jgi:hypothetical protein
VSPHKLASWLDQLAASRAELHRVELHLRADEHADGQLCDELHRVELLLFAVEASIFGELCRAESEGKRA